MCVSIRFRIITITYTLNDNNNNILSPCDVVVVSLSHHLLLSIRILNNRLRSNSNRCSLARRLLITIQSTR